MFLSTFVSYIDHIETDLSSLSSEFVTWELLHHVSDRSYHATCLIGVITPRAWYELSRHVSDRRYHAMCLIGVITPRVGYELSHHVSDMSRLFTSFLLEALSLTRYCLVWTSKFLFITSVEKNETTLMEWFLSDCCSSRSSYISCTHSRLNVVSVCLKSKKMNHNDNCDSERTCIFSDLSRINIPSLWLTYVHALFLWLLVNGSKIKSLHYG